MPRFQLPKEPKRFEFKVPEGLKKLLRRPQPDRRGNDRHGSGNGNRNGNGEGPTVTRRSFALGAAAAAGAVGVGALVVRNLTLKRDKAASEDPSAPLVVDSGDATNITEEFEQVEDLRLVERASWTLPLGSILNAAEGTWLPVVQPGADSSSITAAGAFNISTGENPLVVPTPINNTPATLVLDARCSDSVYAWSEIDLSTRAWTLYGSAFANGQLSGSATALWSADANWDPPFFCCTGNQVLWQVQPSLTGDKTQENSHLYRWQLGSSSADILMESPGRFACEPSVSKDCVTVVPRVAGKTASAYYGITALSKTDPTQQIDQLVMPATVRPFRATRIGDQFAFAVEATYGSGGLLANMGYYLGTSSSHITWLSREPAAGIWGRDGVYAFKSLSSYIVYDEPAGTFSVLLAADRAVDYGEYPAATGDTDSFVTYSTVKDSTTGYPTGVYVRAYDLLTSEQMAQKKAEEAKVKAQEEAEKAAEEQARAEAEESEEY